MTDTTTNDDARTDPLEDEPLPDFNTDSAIDADLGTDDSGDGGWADPVEGDVQRDEHGEIIPKEAQAGALGKVLVLPMTYGKVQSFFGSGTESNLEAKDLAKLFEDHVIKPDLSAHYGGRITPGDVRSMKPLTPAAYLTAIMEVSGVDPEEIQMNDDGSADVTVEGN